MTGFKGRKEDARFLQGAGRYTADWNGAGQLHAAFVRSPHAHADILAVDADEARAAPGVVAVYTGADLAGAGYQTRPASMPLPGRGGTTLITPDRPVLAHDRVRFVGEEVALVIADSRAAAQDAAELVVVDYRDRPCVVGVEQAMAPDAPAVHDHIPGNVCFEHEYGDAAAAEAAIAAAPHVVRLTVDSPRVAPNPMEPRSVLAAYDTAADRYVIRCANQGATEMRGSLAGRLGVDVSRVRMEMVDVGGGFGPRGAPYAEYIALLHAARALGRPVKWTSTRSEDLLIDSHGRGIRLSGELALDRDGTFLAVRTLWLCDEGAYLTDSGPMTNCMNGNLVGGGPYRTPVVHGLHRLLMTNATPTAPYRGAGRPEAAYIIERLVDQAAADLGMDPIALRRKNGLARDMFPYRTPTGSVFDSGDFPALLDAAEVEGDWAGFPARREQSRREGLLRGIGIAMFLESAGGGVPRNQAAVRFDRDGNVTLYIAPTASGQGHETVFSEHVAGLLGLDRDEVAVRAGDPDGPPIVGGGAFGSRSTMTQGSTLSLASEQVVAKARRLAAERMEASEADMEWADGRFTIVGTDRSVTMRELIRTGGDAEGGGHALDTDAELSVDRTFPSAAHVAELVVDPMTGSARVLSYVAVEDIGRVMNPTLVQGQVQGGLVQGAGQVFGEHALYDPDSGQMLAGSFMDYFMPRSDLMPGAVVVHCGVPSPNNPLGAKGVGESGTVGAAPTLMSAMLSALRPAGVTELDMPCTPQRVWAALEAARARRPAQAAE